MTRIDPERNAVVARVKVERRTTCPNAARLVTVRTVAWNGLDTTIKIPGKPNDVEVVALDATNRVIGKSKPVSVRSSRR